MIITQSNKICNFLIFFIANLLSGIQIKFVADLPILTGFYFNSWDGCLVSFNEINFPHISSKFNELDIWYSNQIFFLLQLLLSLISSALECNIWILNFYFFY